MAASTSSRLDVSATNGSTVRPNSARSARAVVSSCSRPRARIATSTPSARRTCAITLPIPRLPPVTIARLPVSSKSMMCCLPSEKRPSWYASAICAACLLCKKIVRYEARRRSVLGLLWFGILGLFIAQSSAARRFGAAANTVSRGRRLRFRSSRRSVPADGVDPRADGLGGRPGRRFHLGLGGEYQYSGGPGRAAAPHGRRVARGPPSRHHLDRSDESAGHEGTP